MQPKHPVYIVSKGRWETRLTSKALKRMDVPYFIVVESHERDAYAAVIDPAKILVLDPAYQRDYDTCDDLDDSKSKGPGPARNFVWDHAVAAGHAWHWVLDDNIRYFARLNHNKKHRILDGAGFRAMEDFSERYDNVAMAGPAYEFFTPSKASRPPFTTNTRIYSCNLIRNDVPFRWRARYNEDTDLSLRLLKAGYCTVLFNAFLQKKTPTQQLRGGNTDEFYLREGTLEKSKMIVRLHPDVARLAWRFGRPHHHVDYRPFKKNRLRLRPGVTIPKAANDYGMRLVYSGGDPVAQAAD